MEEADFIKKYWHPNSEIVTVVNPRSEDYLFQATIETGVDTSTGRMHSEARHYKVAAGGTERFPGPIANMFLDQMSKLVAQDDDKIQFMIDFSLRAQYYDQLTVAVEDLTKGYQPFPEYLESSTEAAKPAVVEQPFAAAPEAPAAAEPAKPTPKTPAKA